LRRSRHITARESDQEFIPISLCQSDFSAIGTKQSHFAIAMMFHHKLWPNKSPERNARWTPPFIRFGFWFHKVVGRAWLSFFR